MLYSRHKSQFIDSEEMDSSFISEFLEDEYIKKIDVIDFRKNLYRIINTELTPIQRRRLLTYMEGINTVKIAKIEGCNQKSVWRSLEYAKKKINKFLRIRA